MLEDESPEGEADMQLEALRTHREIEAGDFLDLREAVVQRLTVNAEDTGRCAGVTGLVQVGLRGDEQVDVAVVEQGPHGRGEDCIGEDAGGSAGGQPVDAEFFPVGDRSHRFVVPGDPDAEFGLLPASARRSQPLIRTPHTDQSAGTRAAFGNGPNGVDGAVAGGNHDRGQRSDRCQQVDVFLDSMVFTSLDSVCHFFQAIFTFGFLCCRRLS